MRRIDLSALRCGRGRIADAGEPSRGELVSALRVTPAFGPPVASRGPLVAAIARRPLHDRTKGAMDRNVPPLAYRRTTAPEPHRDRRRRILADHPEIAALFGWDPLPKYRMGAVLFAQVGISFAIERAVGAAGAGLGLLVIALVAYAIGAILNHYGGVIIHEASHDLCAPTKTQNRWIAIFANLPKVLPYAMTFRRHHMTHHTGMGVVGFDNDLPTRFEQRSVGNVAWRKLAWLALYPFAGALLRGFLRWPNRWEITNVVVQLAFNAAIVVAIGPWALLYLALSTYFSASLHPIAGHFIHEHYLWDESQETNSYYGPLNRVTLNMGYHVEHHDFTQVPGRDLPRLHAIAREHYASLVSHTSWSEVFRIFVRDPRLSHYSRFVRLSPRGSS